MNREHILQLIEILFMYQISELAVNIDKNTSTTYIPGDILALSHENSSGN